jgi:hypothetical protein
MNCDESRYTAEHAKAHHAVTGHTYSLELSTGRIWDYRYVHGIHSIKIRYAALCCKDMLPH